VYLDESNFPLLKKLTIIIPTYQRQAFALRCMQYWSGKDVTIIIIDGSKNSLDINSLSKLKPNINYIHNPVNLYERMLSATNLVETEFSMLGCDDEFYIPSALNSCLVSLSLDNKLITCAGRAIEFNWHKNSIVGGSVYKKLKGLSLDDVNPMDRIKKHFSNYEPAHTYAVCRTSIWKIAAKVIFSKEYPFFASMELQLEFLLLFAGKSLIIPEFFWLRSEEGVPLRGTTTSMIPSYKISKWWFDKNNKKQKKDFLIRMEKACLEINKLTNERYTPKVQAAYEIYIKHNDIGYQKPSIFVKIFRNLPTTVQIMIRRTLKTFRFGVKKKILLIDFAQILENSGVKVDFTELEVIKQIISSYYKK
jgi:glycosyltransferase domain-containing protein|tara:strand:- start:3901 stop:4989 length:1089 start_codon:yes stop_codon:yes gene_type:complete